MVTDDGAHSGRRRQRAERTLVELYLRGTGFDVVSAMGGPEAIATCMQRPFACILLDVVMPGIDGFRAVPALWVVAADSCSRT